MGCHSERHNPHHETEHSRPTLGAGSSWLPARRLAPGGRNYLCRPRSTLNRQGIRPRRGRWSAHDLHVLMRRHRRVHPAAAEHVGPSLYERRAEEARRVIRRLRRRRFEPQAMIARALNARGLTTPGPGRTWTARSVSRVLANRKISPSAPQGQGQASLVFPHSDAASVGTKRRESRFCCTPRTNPPFVLDRRFPSLRIL